MYFLRYKNKETVIHRLNTFAKLTWVTTILILSLLFEHPFYILALLIPLLLAIKSAGIWREWLSMLKLMLWLGAIIIVINALVSYNGEHVLVTAPFTLPVMGRPVITVEAIVYGTVMALKLTVIISVFTFINLTVHPDDIMTAFLKMKFPYKSVLVTSLSTRFVPCLIDDIGRISDAYRTRGVMMDTGNWLKRVKDRAGTIIPLLTNSLDRAVQVAESMEARAFGTGQKRVFYKEIKTTRMDAAAIMIIGVAPLILSIILRTMKYGGYQFYPTLGEIHPDFLEWVFIGLIGLSLASIIPFALLKRRMSLD